MIAGCTRCRPTCSKANARRAGPRAVACPRPPARLVDPVAHARRSATALRTMLKRADPGRRGGRPPPGRARRSRSRGPAAHARWCERDPAAGRRAVKNDCRRGSGSHGARSSRLSQPQRDCSSASSGAVGRIAVGGPRAVARGAHGAARHVLVPASREPAYSALPQRRDADPTGRARRRAALRAYGGAAAASGRRRPRPAGSSSPRARARGGGAGRRRSRAATAAIGSASERADGSRTSSPPNSSAKMHEQRVDAQRVAEDLRRDDVALDLLERRRTAAPTQTAVSGSWKSATRIGGERAEERADVRDRAPSARRRRRSASA